MIEIYFNFNPIHHSASSDLVSEISCNVLFCDFNSLLRAFNASDSLILA